MYNKIKKATITLCFLIGLCTTSYAAIMPKVRKLKDFYQPTTKHMHKRLSCSVGYREAIVQPYFHYCNAYIILSSSENKWQNQLAYPRELSAKVPYTDVPSLRSPWALLGIARTKKSNRARMHLKYKLGISAWIASVIITQLYLNRAEATGHRGNGYRPYDCRWRKEFEQQAEQALEDAQLFKRLYRTGKINKKNIDILGTSTLVALLWAQDQGEYLLTKHYGKYFCNVMRAPACYYYDNNRYARNRYYGKLSSEINTLRDLLGVPHPIGWEAQVGHFLYGGAKAGALAVTAQTIIAAIPGLNIMALGAGGLYVGYKGLKWVDKNFVNPAKGLAEEEEHIKQELFVRALCADEYSIKQAQGWGSFAVTAVLITDGLLDGLNKLVGEAEALEALEAAEALEAIEALETLEAAEAAEALSLLKAVKKIKLPAARNAPNLNNAMKNIETLSKRNFCSYAKQLERMYERGQLKPLNKEQASLLIRIAKKLGVYVRKDRPHVRHKTWNIPHLNIGDDDGQFHVPLQE